MNQSIKTFLALGAFVGLSLSANAAVTVVTPASVVSNNHFTANDWSTTIDGFGLSGGGASGDVLSETHAAGGGGNFELMRSPFATNTITFTLGAASTVDRVHLWLDNSIWGDITGFDLEFSSDGGATFATIPVEAGITFNGAAGDLSVVQTQTFAARNGVDTIRLSNVLVTGGNTAYAGFNEIRFGGDQTAAAVPEPSTTALLGLGGLALILRRRK